MRVHFPNPTPFWGPKAAAGIFASDKTYDNPNIATVTDKTAAEEAEAAAAIMAGNKGGVRYGYASDIIAYISRRDKSAIIKEHDDDKT